MKGIEKRKGTYLKVGDGTDKKGLSESRLEWGLCSDTWKSMHSE